MKRVKSILCLVLLVVGVLACLEVGLRAWKSESYDGLLWLKSSSVNSILHRRYGWMSPPGRKFEKQDSCYGSGSISYNSMGFRAPEPDKISTAKFKVCILGDSTMQGFQIPDGQFLAHALADNLRSIQGTKDVYVLPLAVGGYGTVQEFMLYEDFCKDISPNLVIVHWAGNDVVNNSFLLERHSITDNNTRERPYFENGKSIMRAPYPLRINAAVDDFLIVKLMNLSVLKFSGSLDAQTFSAEQERGWRIAEFFYKDIKDDGFPVIALVQESQERAIKMFQQLGYRLALYRQFTDQEMCLPRDNHPNPLGHKVLLEALIPVIAP